VADAQMAKEKALGKAAARKAKRQPPSILVPGSQRGHGQLRELLGNGALLIDKCALTI